MPRKIEISHRTIIFAFLLVGAIWFLLRILEIIVILLISIILMSALNPTIDRLQKMKFPRWLAIGLIYFLVITIFSVSVGKIIPLLVEQTSNLIAQLPNIVRNIRFANLDASILTSQISEFSQIPGNILKFTAGIFTNLISIFTIGVLTFYLLMERINLKQYLVAMFGDGGEKRAAVLIDKIESSLGGWVRGELVLMTTVGFMCYLGLVLLAVPYALPLAIVAGMLEVVPTIGPIISAVPAIATAAAISPYISLAVAALYFIVQQLENGLLVPKIMQRVTGVNPLVALLSLMIGFNIGGPLGGLLAIPVILVLKVIIFEYLASRKTNS